MLIFYRDLNWNDKKQGQMKLGKDWKDIWLTCKEGDPGYTYNAKTNPMLLGYLKNRLDRICYTSTLDFKHLDVKMVGQQPLDGVFYLKQSRGVEKRLPVLPSDHYGLLASFVV